MVAIRRRTVEECLSLDILVLAREGGLSGGAKVDQAWRERGREVARLSLLMEGDLLRIERLKVGGALLPPGEPIVILRTPTAFGAPRLWFRCPGCKERVRILYLPFGRPGLACRHCHNLTYRSRQRRPTEVEKTETTLKKAEKILRSGRAGISRTTEALRAREEASTRLRELLRAREAEQAYWRALEARRKAEYRRLRRRFLAPQTRRAAPPQEPPPGPRSRGRPKTKRPYHRRRPFLETERQTSTQILCLRCRDWSEPVDLRPVLLPNGRSAVRGRCPTCGAGVCSIIKSR